MGWAYRHSNERAEDIVEHNGNGVVEYRLSEDENVERFVDVNLIENGDDSHRIYS